MLPTIVSAEGDMATGEQTILMEDLGDCVQVTLPVPPAAPAPAAAVELQLWHGITTAQSLTALCADPRPPHPLELPRSRSC